MLSLKNLAYYPLRFGKREILFEIPGMHFLILHGNTIQMFMQHLISMSHYKH